MGCFWRYVHTREQELMKGVSSSKAGPLQASPLPRSVGWEQAPSLLTATSLSRLRRMAGLSYCFRCLGCTYSQKKSQSQRTSFGYFREYNVIGAVRHRYKGN
jgi:hypothetical protein